MVCKNKIDLFTNSPRETRGLGENLGKVLRREDIIALTGELGSGKTTLVQGICKGLGVEDYVTSPSFTLINEYHGRVPVFHMDFYRLDSARELKELGLEEYFCSDGICLVEWAEKAVGFFPADILRINLAYVNETRRKLIFEFIGDGWENVHEEMRNSQ